MNPAPMHHAPMNPALGTLFGPVIGQAFTCVYNSFFMSKADKERLQLSREEYETSVKFHYENMSSQRENLMVELRAQREDLKEQIDANKAQQREGYRLQHWPLNISALDILNASESTHGKALNVIVCVVPNLGQEEASFTGMERLLLYKPCKVAAIAAREFTGGGILFYSDRAKTWMGHGDNLPATLYGLLQTEPTVLIEIRFPEPDQVMFQAFCWGIGFDHDVNTIRPWESGKGKSITIDLTPPLPPRKSPDYKICKEYRKYHLALYLASMVVGAGDMFRTLQHGYDMPDLFLPSMISNPTFDIDFQGIEQEKTSLDWQDLITRYYLNAYVGIAELDKLIASELAAKAALSCHTANQNGLSELFLRKAIEITGSSLTSDTFLRLLSRQPELKRALSVVELPEWESARNAHEENTETMRESAFRAKENIQSLMRSQNT